jgi:hypothetical protein
MSTPTTDPTTATPAEIDAALFPVWERIARARDQLRAYTHKRVPGSYSRTYREPKTDAEMAAMPAYDQREMAAVQARLDEALADAAPLEAEFDRRGGWTRVFLVTNENGHVHSSMNCSTCFPTTQFALVPALSGLSEDAIIDSIGDTACTVCYPTAPTHPAWARSAAARVDEKAARRTAREEAAAARAAKRAANAITAPDGSPLTSWWGDRIDTVREARMELTDEAEARLGGWANADNAAAQAEAAQRIADALAAKLDTTAAQELADAEKRAASRLRRNR